MRHDAAKLHRLRIPGRPAWWYDIVDGLPDPLLRDGHVTVWDRPGLGVEFNVNKASAYLREEDGDFFK